MTGRRIARSMFIGVVGSFAAQGPLPLLPLFPLGTVLFPGMLLPLHIFEPRYRLLVRRSLDRERPFGVVLIRSGTNTGAAAEPHAVGTSASIVGHTPLPDGRSYIVVRGERRFAIEAIADDEQPYLVGRVGYLDDDAGAGSEDLAAAAAEAFAQYLHAAYTAAGDEAGETPTLEAVSEGGPREVAFRIAAGLAIDAEERQRLLEAPSTRERLESEVRLLGRETVLLKELLVRIRASGSGPTLN